MTLVVQCMLVLMASTIHSSLGVSGNCRSNVPACLNGGTCVDVMGSYTCWCKKMFTGPNCQTAIQPAKRKKPTKKKCPKLRIANGVVKYFKNGIARFHCNRGFSLKGPRAKICRRGIWHTRQMSSCRPTKIRKDCKFNSNQPFYEGSVRVLTNTPSLTVMYRCINGYVLKGSAIRKCTNGNWDPLLEPYCIRAKKCKRPESPQQGRMFGRIFMAGFRVRFFCNAGYEIKGSNQSVCKEDGTWDEPVPKCIKIDPLRNLKNAANSLRRHFINRLELLTTDSRARSGLSSGAAGLDLVFVFDSSASVGQGNFKKGIEFAKTIITEFGVSNSTSGTRVAVIVFSTTAEVIFNLKSKRIVDQQAAINTLKNLKLQGGGTATTLALEKIINEVVPEVRKNSKKALFLITDGKSNTGRMPSTPSKVLRDVHLFEIYAIGVTSQVNEKELRDIASEPFRTHVYLLKDFKSLQTLKELITKPKGSNYSDCGDAGDTQLRHDKAPVSIKLQAKEGAWPWIAEIFINATFRCSGVLLADNWVLAAAHCFNIHGKVNPSDVVVVLGEHDRTFVEGSEQNIRCEKIIMHRKASTNKLEFDLALLKLQQKAKLTAYVRKICLPDDTDRIVIRPNGYGIVTGWGSAQTSDGRPAFKLLMQRRLQLISQHSCQRDTPFNINDKMTCAVHYYGNSTDCVGDIGAPIMVHRSHRSEWVLAGFAVRLNGCPQNGKPAVFSNLLSTSYKRWILRRIKPRKSRG